MPTTLMMTTLACAAASASAALLPGHAIAGMRATSPRITPIVAKSDPTATKGPLQWLQSRFVPKVCWARAASACQPRARELNLDCLYTVTALVW